MPRERDSEEKIIYALKQIEGGAKGLEMCRELGISEATLYNWKKRYAGMGVSELRRLKQLEEENRRLAVAASWPSCQNLSECQSQLRVSSDIFLKTTMRRSLSSKIRR